MTGVWEAEETAGNNGQIRRTLFPSSDGKYQTHTGCAQVDIDTHTDQHIGHMESGTKAYKQIQTEADKGSD